MMHALHILKFYSFLTVLYVFNFGDCEEEELMQCSPWQEIEKKIKELISEVTCTKNDNCSRMSCFLEKFSIDVKSYLQTHFCETPLNVEFNIDAPKLNIISWNRRFYHGDSFSLSNNITGEFMMVKDKSNFKLSLIVKLPINQQDSSVWHLLAFPRHSSEFDIFQDVLFPVPKCSYLNDTASVSRKDPPTTHLNTTFPLVFAKGVNPRVIIPSYNCSISNSSCLLHEICKQINLLSPQGICVCDLDYRRDEHGLCTYDPTSSTTTTTAIPIEPTLPSNKEHSSITKIALEVSFGVLAVLLLCIGCAFVIKRFRICMFLRRRFRVQVYEHVLLGDEDDVDDELSNPVA